MKYLLTCFIVATFSLLQAQSNFKISGSVTDDKNEVALEYVKVTLLKASDSSAKAGAYTNSEGLYSISFKQKGDYLLQFSAFDYDDKYLNISLSSKKQIDGSVKLHKTEFQVEEGVDVVYEKQILESSIDKKVYDPSQDLSTQAGTVTDMLGNVPSVEVDQDGNISLRGNQNVTILIDGLPSNLTGENLSSLPASSIERVEIVSNPSAKYDPDGTAGIINLVLKKNKLRGLNGNVNASAATGNQYNLNASVNARTEKFNLFASYGFRHYEGYRNHFSDWVRDFGDSTTLLHQEREGTDLNVNHTARLGIDYNIKDNQVISFSSTASVGERDRFGDQYNSQFINDDLSYYWNRVAYDPRNRKSLDLSLNYIYRFKEDKGDLKLSAKQSWGDNTSIGNYTQRYFDDDSTQYGDLELQNIENLSANSWTTLALDVTKNLNKNNKFEYGAKYIGNTNDKTAYSESNENGSSVLTPDTNINNRFVFEQNVFAAYGIYGQKINKFGYQVGVRLEQALTSPRLITTNQNFSNDYFSFFPSAHLSYEAKKKLEFTASYSRRINRPSSWNLNPFPSYSDPLNLRVGNPALNPEYINSYEVGMIKDWKKLNFSSSLYLRHTTDVIQRIKEFYDDGTSAVLYQNLSEKYNYGLELVGVYRPLKIWKNIVSVNAYGTEFKNDGAQNVTNNAGFSWNVKLNSTIDLFDRTTTVQLTTSYFAKRVTAQGYIQPKRGIDISVNRRFFENKLTVGLQALDIFDNKGFVFEVQQGNLTQTSEYKWQSRRFQINVSYKFGKLEMGNNKDLPRSGGEGFDF